MQPPGRKSRSKSTAAKKSGRKHTCRRSKLFTLDFSRYPKAIFVCRCGKVLKSTPLDDLSKRDMDIAIEMIRRYFKGK